MNNIEKIEALLEQPNVSGFFFTGYDTTRQEVGTPVNQKFYCSYFQWQDRSMGVMIREGMMQVDIDSLKPEIYKTEAWPEIREGDLIMTPDGEGEALGQGFACVVCINNELHTYERHEIALLQKAGES